MLMLCDMCVDTVQETASGQLQREWITKIHTLLCKH